MSKLLDGLNYYIIKYLLKVNKIVNKNGLCENQGVCGFSDIKNMLNYKKICIQLYEKDNKEELFKVLPLLLEAGKDIEIIDFEEKLVNDDIRKLGNFNQNIRVNFRHMIDSFYYGNNVETTYNMEEYSKILDKIEYLAKVTKQNFNRRRRTSNVCY